jgi:acid stress chaperone HdeB
MRCKMIVIAVTLLSGTTWPAMAQVKLDMNQITCRDWLSYDPENQNFVRYWMSGYYNAAANSNVLNYDRMQKNSAKVMAYCKNHQSDTLPTAIKNSAS